MVEELDNHLPITLFDCCVIIAGISLSAGMVSLALSGKDPDYPRLHHVGTLADEDHEHLVHLFSGILVLGPITQASHFLRFKRTRWTGFEWLWSVLGVAYAGLPIVGVMSSLSGPLFDGILMERLLTAAFYIYYLCPGYIALLLAATYGSRFKCLGWSSWLGFCVVVFWSSVWTTCLVV